MSVYAEIRRGRDIISDEQVKGLLEDKTVTAPMREFVRLEEELSGQHVSSRDPDLQAQVIGFKGEVRDIAAGHQKELGRGMGYLALSSDILDTMRDQVTAQPEDVSEIGSVDMYDEAVAGMQKHIGELYDEAAKEMPYPLVNEDTPEDAV